MCSPCSGCWVLLRWMTYQYHAIDANLNLSKLSNVAFTQTRSKLTGVRNKGENTSPRPIVRPFMLSWATFLNLLSSGRTTFPRSGLSFRRISAHCRGSLAKHKASSTGQSGTAGSSIPEKVLFSIARSM